MNPFAARLTQETAPSLGMIVLQADLTVEADMRRMVPLDTRLLVSRVPSGDAVTPESLSAMEGHLAAAAGLFPRGHAFDVVAYACTSGAAQIGSDRVADRVLAGTEAGRVTDPVTALLAACTALGAARLAILSPYIAPVSERLRQVLAARGVETPGFGTFAEPEEARVARIDAASVCAATQALVERAPPVDAVFLSCTNLRTLGVIDRLETTLGLPVLSSNLVLAWHMLRLCRAPALPQAPGRLFAAHPPG